MIESISIKRFKRFDAVDIPLANPVVFVGPNNSGKTSALQALALWAYGLKKWNERRSGGQSVKRTGVSINRRELTNIPLLNSHSLWRNMRVRQANTPIRIEIEVKGIYNGELWSCGFEFETVDQENLRCRPIKNLTETDPKPEDEAVFNQTYTIPDGARAVKVAFLPPMSGLVSQEDLLQPGSIERRIGEGRTADVLRNLCYRIFMDDKDSWKELQTKLTSLFGVHLQEPVYNRETGTLSVFYKESEASKVEFDLNASGQGFRQTLLLLAYLYLNKNTVLLLDEPDAHLEILRQRQIFQVFTDVSNQLGSQVVIATHSEVILDEAAQTNLVVAFVGNPHQVKKTADIQKALAKYGYENYLKAEQTGWVLYLEGATDKDILLALAKHLDHPAREVLEQRVFLHYVANEVKDAEEHFSAIREAFDVVGLAIFDRLGRQLDQRSFKKLTWRKREIENYIGLPEALLAFAENSAPNDLFNLSIRLHRRTLMENLIADYIPRVAFNNRKHEWWSDTKMSDLFLTPLFRDYYEQLALPNQMYKSGFHKLASYIPHEFIDSEVVEKLDAIVEIADEGAEKRLAWTKLNEEDTDEKE